MYRIAGVSNIFVEVVNEQTESTDLIDFDTLHEEWIIVDPKGSKYTKGQPCGECIPLSHQPSVSPTNNNHPGYRPWVSSDNPSIRRSACKEIRVAKRSNLSEIWLIYGLPANTDALEVIPLRAGAKHDDYKLVSYEELYKDWVIVHAGSGQYADWQPCGEKLSNLPATESATQATSTTESPAPALTPSKEQLSYIPWTLRDKHELVGKGLTVCETGKSQIYKIVKCTPSLCWLDERVEDTDLRHISYESLCSDFSVHTRGATQFVEGQPCGHAATMLEVSTDKAEPTDKPLMFIPRQAAVDAPSDLLTAEQAVQSLKDLYRRSYRNNNAGLYNKLYAKLHTEAAAGHRYVKITLEEMGIDSEKIREAEATFNLLFPSLSVKLSAIARGDRQPRADRVLYDLVVDLFA